MVSKLAEMLYGTMKLTYIDKEIDLTPPWDRMTMIEAVKKFSGADFEGITDVETARKMADEHDVEYGQYDGVGKIINAFFEKFVEENLIQPTIITGHPWKSRRSPNRTGTIRS